MPLLVRPATVDDSRRVAEIHVSGWRAAYRGQMPDSLLDSLSVDERAEKRRQWLSKPMSPEHRTWVAEDDAGVVAFANTAASRDADAAPGTGELLALYADPARWGTGAGRALVCHVVDDLTGRGASAITLWVLDANVRARRFYGIAGFRADGGVKTAPFGGVILTEVRYRLGP